MAFVDSTATIVYVPLDSVMLESHVGVEIEDELVVKPNSAMSQQVLNVPLIELVHTSVVVYPGEASPSP